MRKRRFAYNPEAIRAFVAAHTEYRAERVASKKNVEYRQRQKVRYFNARPWGASWRRRSYHRWVSGKALPSRHGVKNFLEAYGLTVEYFIDWSNSNNINPILREATDG